MMIYNELPTAFPWYDKLEKQQRFRENAQKACDYRLISPKNSLLPFQFKVNYNDSGSMTTDDDMVYGEFLSVGGYFGNDEKSIRTGYVPVSGGETIYYRTGMIFGVLCAYFDEAYTYISQSSSSSQTGTITTPSNARFVVFNVSSDVEFLPKGFNNNRLITTSGGVVLSATGWRATSVSNAALMFPINHNETYFYSGIINPNSPPAAGVTYWNSSLNLVGFDASDLMAHTRKQLSPPPSAAYMAVCGYSAIPVIEKMAANRSDYNKFIFAIRPGEPPTDPMPGNITRWKIVSCCGSEIDLSDNISDVSHKMHIDGVRYFYKGGKLSVTINGGQQRDLNMPPGSYYSIIEFNSGAVFFSEVFTVPNNPFNLGEPSEYMKLDYWNSCDINPIMYHDGSGGWRQTMYIDSYIHASEPEVEEDGERDGNDMLIPTFQRMVVRYRFSAAVPDFIKIAMVSMQIHDNIFVTTDNDVRSGQIERMSTSATIDDNGAYSILDVVFEQNVMVKKSCCSNMTELNP